MDFKPGDVVMLKSGGHPMTVADVSDDAITCLWMGTDGELLRDKLPLAVLERFMDDDGEEDEDDEEEEEEEEEEDED